MAQMLVLN